MARPKGSLNHDHEETRRAILLSLQRRLMSPGGASASFRDLAASAGVNPATLRHYFKTREELLKAVFVTLHEAGARFISEGASSDRGDVRSSLRWFLGFFLEGWLKGLGHMHTLGLTAGLGDPELGPAYLTEMLEPSLQAAEVRIARHVAQGELGPCNIRHAAIEFVAPFMFALLHQRELRGEHHRLLQLEDFIEDHVERFLRAHAVGPGGPPPPARAVPPPKKK